MALIIYNTLSRKKEQFEPLEPGKVKFYVCGVTVYDFNHLGHARTYIVYDTVRRYLKSCGYDVTYIQNFTDIDDKILNRAKRDGTSMAVVAQTYIDAYYEDMAKLNILPADEYPRATETIPEITDFIQQLEAGGYAYPANGDVYYSVRRFPDYGKLSGKRLADLEAGASERVNETELNRKKDPFDFALWKAAKPEEPAWDSPWGAGRPGWHIECSAMLRSRLGETVDIHAGGEDLQFPHHENEIAQSEAVTGKPLARYWMHNGFLNVLDKEGKVEKMSKSLGNFTTLRELFKTYPPMALRMLVLKTHYRNPIGFTLDLLDSALAIWRDLEEVLQLGSWLEAIGQPLEGQMLFDPWIADFQNAMDDDFNTPEALVPVIMLYKQLGSRYHEVVHGKTLAEPEQFAHEWRTLVYLCDILGLKAEAPIVREVALLEPDIQVQIALRQQARDNRDWAEADRIRRQLLEKGIVLIDHKHEPTTWRFE